MRNVACVSSHHCVWSGFSAFNLHGTHQAFDGFYEDEAVFAECFGGFDNLVDGWAKRNKDYLKVLGLCKHVEQQAMELPNPKLLHQHLALHSLMLHRRFSFQHGQ